MPTVERQIRRTLWIACVVTALTASSSIAQRSGASPVHLRYLGTAGWQIDDGKTVVLIDPYLSRLRRITPNDDTLPGDSRRLVTNDDVAEPDTATVDAHIHRADFILVTHTHYDHVFDVPDIARKTGAPSGMLSVSPYGRHQCAAL